MTVQKISDTEWKVMHVVWNLGSVIGNDVIAELVPETGWNPNTVRTLLVRLADKGILQVEKTRGKEKDYPTLVYTPLYSREECVAAHSQTFLEKVFEGDTSKLLVHFFKDGQLTPKQIAELRNQLNDLDQ